MVCRSLLFIIQYSMIREVVGGDDRLCEQEGVSLRVCEV
jgi:hypothetical protein